MFLEWFRKKVLEFNLESVMNIYLFFSFFFNIYDFFRFNFSNFVECYCDCVSIIECLDCLCVCIVSY